MPALNSLVLDGNRGITAEGVKSLRAARPTSKVSHRMTGRD
jgi:hypothetical protein